MFFKRINLEARALVCKLSDAVEDDINNLLSYGVMATGVVISGIFLAGNELFWVKQLPVSTGTNFI